VDLGDRVLSTPPGPEPIRARLKAGLEDRLQHQLQRRLDNPVRNRGDGDFILPLLQSRLGLIWFVAIGAGHGRALTV
jgi:hypothetical protein